MDAAAFEAALKWMRFSALSTAAVSVRGPVLPGGGRRLCAAYPAGFRPPSAPPRPAIEGSPS
jgi:hypothetical protein